MSSYMQALQRLERQGGAAAPARRESVRPVRDVDPPAAARAPARPAGAAAHAALLDRLRALPAAADGPRVLVFAPVAAGGAAQALVDGLAARGGELAMRIPVAALVRRDGQAVLVERGGGARPIDLDGGGRRAGIAAWLEQSGAAPLALVEAPPPGASADGLLLAADCDGLVLVAATGVTPRAALQEAAARARAAGCRLLGVVLSG